ncbi:MAG: LuxR family transcriptional regulator [Coriobacteriales bacterium]|nr:LuxR family transcriptional regulator [Coriobacteriales bacterium]
MSKRDTTHVPAELPRVDVRLLGFAIPLSLSDLLIRNVMANSVMAQLVYYMAFSVPLLLLALGAGLYLRSRRAVWQFTPHLAVLGAVMLSAAFAMLLVASSIGGIAPYVVAAVLGGMGLAGCYAQWLLFYATVSLRTAAASLLAAFSLGMALRFASSWLAAEAVVAAAVLIVPVACVLYLLVKKSYARQTQPTGQQTGQPTGQQTGQPPARPAALGAGQSKTMLVLSVVMLVVYSLVLALIRFAHIDEQYVNASNNINLTFRLLVPLVLIPFALRGSTILRIFTLVQVSLVLVSSSLLAAQLLPASLLFVKVAMSSFVRGMLMLFMYLSVVELFKVQKYHPLTVAGVVVVSFTSAQGVGLLLTSQFGIYINGDIIVICIYVLTVLSALALAIAGSRATMAAAAKHGAAAQIGQVGGGGEVAVEEEAVEVEAGESPGDAAAQQRFCVAYSLTPREAEVLQHFRQGRSVQHIAKTLRISENTVRGYSKSLYLKCGIHSRQQLLDLVEGFEEKEQPAAPADLAVPAAPE